MRDEFQRDSVVFAVEATEVFEPTTSHQPLTTDMWYNVTHEDDGRDMCAYEVTRWCPSPSSSHF